MSERNWDDWSVEDSEEPKRVPVKGQIVTKSALANLFGYAVATLDKMIAEGLPVVERGARRLGYRINTADAHQWIVRHAVALATGSEEASKFDSAKARDKDAQARLREFKLAREMGLTILRSEAAAVYAEQVGEFRKRLFEIPDQVTGLTDEQRRELNDAIDVAMAEFSGLPSEGDDHV